MNRISNDARTVKKPGFWVYFIILEYAVSTQLEISSRRELGTAGHVGTFGLEPSNAKSEN